MYKLLKQIWKQIIGLNMRVWRQQKVKCPKCNSCNAFPIKEMGTFKTLELKNPAYLCRDCGTNFVL